MKRLPSPFFSTAEGFSMPDAACSPSAYPPHSLHHLVAHDNAEKQSAKMMDVDIEFCMFSITGGVFRIVFDIFRPTSSVRTRLQAARPITPATHFQLTLEFDDGEIIVPDDGILEAERIQGASERDGEYSKTRPYMSIRRTDLPHTFRREWIGQDGATIVLYLWRGDQKLGT